SSRSVAASVVKVIPHIPSDPRERLDDMFENALVNERVVSYTCNIDN
ncbi:24411_t:CDS:2, partial [Dentiscutata erythropus]